jgi:alpha-tubulin suppressor-like RCC1 family protein
VLTTGAGSYGRLGNFETVDQLYLEPVEILTPESNIVSISGGKSFTLALSRDGVVYGWGRNHKGQLGTGLGLAVDMYAMQVVPEPIETSALSTRHIVSMSAGHSHAAALSDQGEMFYWGMALHMEPVLVEELLHTRIVAVSCGHDYTLALDEQGTLYSVGLGKTGVLGQGSVRRLGQPAVLEALDTNGASSSRRVVQFSAGWKHAACVVEESV